MLPVRLERGNCHAHLALDVDDEHVLCYFEEWSDVEELNEQIRSPRFGQLLALMETAGEAPSLQFRFFSEIRGLDYVAELRGDQHPANGR
jgi:quinol monooxygenase YgiN